MKKSCLIFQNENIYMHLHCYIENDEMYFKLIEIYTLFRYSVNIKILIEYSEIIYRSFKRFINSNKNNKYIHKSDLLFLYPILIDNYIDLFGTDGIFYKLPYLYTYLKKRKYYNLIKLH